MLVNMKADPTHRDTQAETRYPFPEKNEDELTKGEKSFMLDPGAGLKVALKYWSPPPPIGGPPVDMSSIPVSVSKSYTHHHGCF